jgi:hypothetical protein
MMKNPMDKGFLLNYLKDCYVPDSSGCWIYRGITGKNTTAYPKIRIADRTYHVVTILLWCFGRIPEPIIGKGRDKCHCHTCDVRRCVNPDHIFIGTAEENAYDALAKGRLIQNRTKVKTECIRGHIFNEINTVIDSAGYRRCRTCQYERNRRRIWSRDTKNQLVYRGVKDEE